MTLKVPLRSFQQRGTFFCTFEQRALKGWGLESGRIFSENLIASPFQEDILTDTTFSQIHLAGEYL
jgi:hypothetical protein